MEITITNGDWRYALVETDEVKTIEMRPLGTDNGWQKVTINGNASPVELQKYFALKNLLQTLVELDEHLDNYINNIADTINVEDPPGPDIEDDEETTPESFNPDSN